MKTYIGDGIYAELNEQGLVLTTENGYATTNRIVIEPQEWLQLVNWLRHPRDYNARTPPSEKGWPS